MSGTMTSFFSKN